MDLNKATWRKASRSSSEGDHCVEVAAVWRKASRSSEEGDHCVEAAAVWCKASHSGPEGDHCVEVAATPGVVALRDSKAPESGNLLLGREAARELSAHIKAL